MKAALIFILLVGSGFAYFQPMRWLIDSWLVNPYYKHGFIVALAAVGLAGFNIVKTQPTEAKTQQWIYYFSQSNPSSHGFGASCKR